MDGPSVNSDRNHALTVRLGRRLLHARGLALEAAQEIQLRAANAGRTDHVHFRDRRRVQREDALDPLAEGHLADGKRRTRPAAVEADDDALEDLDALLVALAHLDVHAHRVAGLHVRSSRQLRLLDQLNRAHVVSPVPSESRPASPALRRRAPPCRAAPDAARASAAAPPAFASVAPPRGGPTAARPAPSAPGKLRRPRVMRVVQQPARKRVLFHRPRVADDARHEPAHCVHDDQRGKFAAAQDVVPNRQLLGRYRRPDPLVHSLISAAEQHDDAPADAGAPPRPA